MKTTSTDYDLADRFPEKPTSSYGYGISASTAKISPAQLERLLNLKLIKLAPAHGQGVYAGADSLKSPGRGTTGREHATFVRTYKTRPTK